LDKQLAGKKTQHVTYLEGFQIQLSSLQTVINNLRLLSKAFQFFLQSIIGFLFFYKIFLNV